MTDKRVCGAKTRNGTPCKTPPMEGGTRCRMHGGASPQARKKAAERLADEKIRRTLNNLRDIEPVANPLEALRLVAGEILAVKDAAAGLVEKLDEVRYEGKSGEQIRGELLVYERALDRSVSALSTIARLNIDERLAAITERQAEKVIAAIEAALTAAGISDENTLNSARAAAGRHLAAVPNP